MRYSILIAASALLILSGCEKDHEKVMRDTTAKWKEAAAILATVKDEASAKAAAPKLREVADDLKTLQQTANHLGEATAKQKTDLNEKYGTDFLQAGKALQAEITRIKADAKLSAPLDQALDTLGWSKL